MGIEIPDLKIAVEKTILRIHYLTNIIGC